MKNTYYPTKLWKKDSPENLDIDSKVFQRMLNTIKEDFQHINSVLVIKNDKILFEKYFNGYDRCSLQNTGCIFKSFISAAVGVAIENNIIDSLDTKIVDIFSEVTPNSIDNNMRKITLRHALTKSTGLDWHGPGYYDNTENFLYDDIRLVYDLNVEKEPGKVFKYKLDPHILVYALSQLSGEEFSSYIHTNLLSPLGIVNYQWDTSFQSIERLQMTVRDIAKLGYLYLCQGIWEDTRLIPKDYIIESTKPQISGDFPEQAEYGYLWWNKEISGVKTYYASGFGGQYLFVIPEHNMIFVITSKMDKPHPENKVIVRNFIDDMTNGIV